MGRIVLDANLRAQLNGLNEKVEVWDENDQPVGIFLPKAEYQKLLYANEKIPFSEEEIERRIRNSSGGCSLHEIWTRLEKEHNVKIHP
jgi:hypothetical protein